MDTVDYYLGIFEKGELIGVINLGEGQGSFEWYGKEGLGMQPIDEVKYMEFVSKHHREK